jgi:hypothetical protein
VIREEEPQGKTRGEPPSQLAGEVGGNKTAVEPPGDPAVDPVGSTQYCKEDSGRDLLSGLQDVYLSTLSNRTNTVMKIVAVFSSVFLPLTFITGVFGMNFEFMPLIHRSWGFALSVVGMLLIVSAMLGYFRYKRWL